MAPRDEDLHRDLSQWVDELTARYLDQGLGPAEARRRALIDLEGFEQAKGRARDARLESRLVWWSLDRLRSVSIDVFRGFRSGKTTLALAFAILTVVLAAGVVTFSVVDAIALRPLPYGNPDRLVAIGHLPRPDGNLEGTSPQDFFAWREGTRSFSGLAGGWGGGVGQLADHPAGGDISAARVTVNLFDVLQVKPAFGRVFAPEDERSTSALPVVIAHSLWIRAFDADPGVIGTRVVFVQRASKVTCHIIGVLPPGVTYPITGAARPVELFRPYVATPAERDHGAQGRSYGLQVVGRLRAEVTVEQARADVQRVVALVRTAYPQSNLIGGATVVLPLLDRVAGPARSWLLLSLAAVGCVVLIGCVNAASLLLARATVRTREYATRAAIGASQARIAGSMLLEGLLLTFIASGAALVLALGGTAFARTNLPEGLARTPSIGLDWRVFLASMVAAMACGLLAGGVPAWRVWRSDLFRCVKSGAVVLGGRRQARSLGLLLSAEVAFVAVLLVGMTLTVVSFVRVTTADLGFDRRDVMTFSIARSRATRVEMRGTEAEAFFEEVAGRARLVPGVRAVGVIMGGQAPLQGGSVRYSLEIPGVGEVGGADMFETRMVSPGYFQAMGLRLVRGRTFDSNDRAGSSPVIIVNDLAARRYFPGRDAVGELVTFNGTKSRIVGVTEDVRFQGPEADSRAELYVPIAHSRFFTSSGELVVRTTGDARLAAPAIREAIRPALSDSAAPEARFIDDAFRRLTAGRRFNSGVMSIFGALALVIGAIGIYGTMAFVVAQQTRAIGLKMALGASERQVLRSVLRESVWRVTIGVVLGLLAARAAADVFTSLVFGVQTTSPVVYGGVTAGLIVLGLIGALVPALRASRVDPLTALRAD